MPRTLSSKVIEPGTLGSQAAQDQKQGQDVRVAQGPAQRLRAPVLVFGMSQGRPESCTDDLAPRAPLHSLNASSPPKGPG